MSRVLPQQLVKWIRAGSAVLTARWSQSGSLWLPGSAPKDSDYVGWGGVWPGHQDFESTPGIFNVQPV